MTLDAFPRHPLLFGPSPVHELERLTAHLGGARLWAKRDDCNSGLAYGGNKTRKLEYLIADALAQGCDTLVSIGGVQSNHTRQVAAAAARTGMGCVLVQESWVDWPDVTYDRVGNILLSRLMGADVRLVRAGFGIGFKESWEQALADVEAAGGKPYAIPAGASDHRLGGLGFANWAREVEAQERELGVFFDTVVVCAVTGSTQAGMVAGFAAGERERRVLGIDGPAGRDARAGRADRPRDGRADRPRARAARRRGRARRALPRRHVRDTGRADARGDAARRAAGGHDHRPGLRGEVDGRHDRSRESRGDRPRFDGAVRPSGRPAGAQRVRGSVHLAVRLAHLFQRLRPALRSERQ
jgi:1-aminocyclopropane-1-carboxylate deaminase